MKTSSRLSLQFTLISTGLLLSFAVVVNVLFFRSWYKNEIRQLNDFSIEMQNKRLKNKNYLFKEKILRIPSQEFKLLETKKTLLEDVVRSNDQVIIKLNRNNSVFVANVTPMIERQRSLLQLCGLLVLVGSAISRLLSRRYARRALRDVYTVADWTQSINIQNLDQTLDLDHLPEDDEIRTIADSLNTMTTKLHDQVGQIRRFVGNLSHEIKTPLAASRMHAELALRTSDYEQGLQTSLSDIDQLNRLVDTMTLLHQSEHRDLNQSSIKMEGLLQTIINQVQLSHPDSAVRLQTAISDKLSLIGDRGAREIVLRNLIDNAYKYTPTEGYITITADESHLAIHNTGSSLTDEQIAHIREPLWQADSSKSQDHGFGLGLTLVQTLVEKMGRTIDVVSDNSGVRFVIEMGE